MTRFNQGTVLVFLSRLGAPGDMQGVLRVRNGDGPFTPAEYIAALRFMQRLGSKGFIQVIKHPGDRRLFFVLTPAGLARAEEFGFFLDRIEQARTRLEVALSALATKAGLAMDRNRVPGRESPLPVAPAIPPVSPPAPNQVTKRSIECPKCYTLHAIARVSARFALTRDFWCECGFNLTKAAKVALGED